jgi:hypothetical protein
MDRARHQLLPRARFARYERRRVRARGLRDQLVNRNHRRAAPDQPCAREIVEEHGACGLALSGLGDFGPDGDVAPKEISEGADLERLGDEIAGSLGQGLNGQVYRTLRRNQNDRRLRADGAQLADDLNPVAVRHEDVANDRGEALLAGGLDRLAPGADCGHKKAVERKPRLQGHSDRAVVISD